MGVTARGVAVFCGAILAAIALAGFLIDRTGPWAQDFLIASWLPPIVLFPAAALAAALGGASSDRLVDHSRLLWPVYLGLVLYGAVAGSWWLHDASQLTPEIDTTTVTVAVMAAHAAVFILAGGVFAVFPRTRPAAFQIWLGYVVLVASWLAGAAFVRPPAVVTKQTSDLGNSEVIFSAAGDDGGVSSSHHRIVPAHQTTASRAPWRCAGPARRE
jgi:hypothetical protein